MDARKIANTSIATKQQDTAAQSCFDCYDQIETIDDEILLFSGTDRDASRLALCPTLIRTGGTGHRESLPFIQSKSITDQLHRAFDRVATSQQPRQVGDGGAQPWQLIF